MSDWIEISTASAGNEGCPGDQYHITEATLSQRGDRWRCVVEDEWGSNQGCRQPNGSRETEGRGDSPDEAVEACRKDVMSWGEGYGEYRTELATMLRKLMYAAEDAEETEDD